MRDHNRRYIDPTPLEVQWRTEAMPAPKLEPGIIEDLVHALRTSPDDETRQLALQLLRESGE